jgi:hypothetical protein
MTSELDQAVAECKGRCFRTLVDGMSSRAAGGAVGRIPDDELQRRYRTCLATCKRAKELAEAVENDNS